MADDGEGPDISRARICIDFGTALSKASLCVDPTMPLDVGVRPIAIGAAAGADYSLLTPSVLYVDGGRLYFGPVALERARGGIEGDRDPLLSFKTVLGARDVEAALASRIGPSIDPTGTLKQRDALVLYLAYLDQLIREALANAPGLPENIAQAKRRYTSPVWKRGDDGQDDIYRAIFNEAAAVSAKLSKLFLSNEGISIAQCKDALDKAAASPGDGLLETGVFEPHAAAAASLAFTTAPTRFVLVFDMGAGTTDMAAFEFDESCDPPTLSEIKEARQCSPLAGDAIDSVLIDLVARKRGVGKSREDDLKFIRAARLAARNMKRDLFLDAKATLKESFRSTTVRLNDLLEDPKFREFLGALTRTIAASLTPVLDRAEAVNAPIVDIVLAGGGSHLPFLPDLVRAAAAQRGTSVSLRIEPLSPFSPLYHGVDRTLGGVFPQLAMSIGGALVEMVPP